MKGRRLQDVRGTLENIKARAKDFGDDYLRVTVETETALAGISSEVRALLPNAIDIRIEAAEVEPDQNNYAAIEAMGPLDLFAEYYRQTQKSEAPDEMLQLFRKLHEGIKNETRSAGA